MRKFSEAFHWHFQTLTAVIRTCEACSEELYEGMEPGAEVAVVGVIYFLFFLRKGYRVRLWYYNEVERYSLSWYLPFL